MTRLLSLFAIVLLVLTGCSEAPEVQEPTEPAVTFAAFDVFGSEFEKYDEKTIAETLDRFEQKYGIRPFDKRPWPLEEV